MASLQNASVTHRQLNMMKTFLSYYYGTLAIFSSYDTPANCILGNTHKTLKAIALTTV